MYGNLFESFANAYVAYPGGKAFYSTGKIKVLLGGRITARATFCGLPTVRKRRSLITSGFSPVFVWSWLHLLAKR